MVTVTQLIDEMLRFAFFCSVTPSRGNFQVQYSNGKISRQQPVWFLQDSPRLKIVVDKNRFGSKIDPVRTGSKTGSKRFRLLDNQNISSTSHVPANLFPIMSHLHESWFKTHQTDFMFSDSNNRLFNAYLKCSNKKHLKILIMISFNCTKIIVFKTFVVGTKSCKIEPRDFQWS